MRHFKQDNIEWLAKTIPEYQKYLKEVYDGDKRFQKLKEKPLIIKSSKDVTGGMKRKVDEATKISKSDMNVFFVNGNKPERIIDAIKRKKFQGTLFKGR